MYGKLIIIFLCVCCVTQSMTLSVSTGAEGPSGVTYTNSLGMKFVRIEAGSFEMGFEDKTLSKEVLSSPSVFATGDFDEHPKHKVEIELFDPGHKSLRGKLKFSKNDDEAVVFVSWYDAMSFCRWLSEKDGLTYRLATEAEWEYACRAGTNTAYSTGDMLGKEFHKNVRRSWYPDARTTDQIKDPKWVDRKEPIQPELTVGQTPPNPWGLYDMHGNVEEWCYDWYGPYESNSQIDPVGYATGDFKVSRGGSHSTELYYLRSANRMGTLPEDRHWYIGFRVVIGALPDTTALEISQQKQNISQTIPADVTVGPDPDKPYFKGPRVYVKIPANSEGPLFSGHNHDPGIVECPNGDLVAIWYSCYEEDGREVSVGTSRLGYGSEQWEPARPFWDAPDRNDHCPGLWFDGDKTIYHFNGLSAAATWGSLGIIMRTSTDSGATWSRARLIVTEHGYRQMVGEPAFRTQDGTIVFGADAIYGSTVWISRDNGLTWSDPGGQINGIHAGIVQLNDGRLMALGRGMNVDSKMPMSISSDMGKSWQAQGSVFQPVSDGQRLALMRLKEGPLFLAAFTPGMTLTDAAGKEREVTGLFAALSYDDGKTWPYKRLVTDDGAAKKLDGGAWTDEFVMGPNKAEPKGYMSVCQGLDGVINLISSALHYQFNEQWIKTPMPPIEN
ncbi:MAG: SUMF1/EgtB/PvdO family nonheme iron enzyme [Planctomycetota bacterium]